MMWWKMRWTRRLHAKGCVREWMNKWSMQGDLFANGWPCEDVFTDKQTEEHAKICSPTDEQMNKWCMWADVFTNIQPCEDVFSDGWMDEHAFSQKNNIWRCFREQTNEQTCIFVNGRTCQACQSTKKEKWVKTTSSEPNDHRSLRTPGHVELKLWYTKRKSITQQHCSSTCTPARAWKYQYFHVELCNESC